MDIFDQPLGEVHGVNIFKSDLPEGHHYAAFKLNSWYLMVQVPEQVDAGLQAIENAGSKRFIYSKS